MSNNPADGGGGVAESKSNHHTINIRTPNSDRMKQMHRKISQPPKLLTPTAGKTSCSIFRAPSTFVDINGNSYQPHIVSIGPYHRGKPQLAMIEEHKWRYLGSLLARIQSSISLETLIGSISQLESDIRSCYSEEIQISSEEFVESMVVDGCFLIELFRKVAGIVRFEDPDPIVSMSWIIPFFYRDFLRLENQIPFFVLETLFGLTELENGQTKEGTGNVNVHHMFLSPHHKNRGSFNCRSNTAKLPSTVSALAINFFNNSMQRPDEIVEKYKDLKAKHLLDLVRLSYTQFEGRSALVPRGDGPPSHIIHCISKLRRAGIKLRPAAGSPTLLQVKFRRGVLEMPPITIDDFMSSFLFNVVAYEQCHAGCQVKHFTTYATLLDSLVNTFRDVEYLCDKDILENYMGTDADVARFLNNLGKEVAFEIDTCYLATLFNDVHEYYGNNWHVTWASFKFTYFQTPWSFISALAAFVLLGLTVLQTVYTIYGSYAN
ncbi:UPF0481 protein At3g47200 [Linum grandiflorum]